MMPTELDEIVTFLEPRLHCNCDLDRWEPEANTGHSLVCRIHNAATKIKKVLDAARRER